MLIGRGTASLFCALAVFPLVVFGQPADAHGAPQPGTMTVTGYNVVTAAGGPKDPVTVSANPKQSAAIYSSLRHLRGAPKALCMESVTVVSIRFVLEGTTHPRYVVTANPCGPPGFVEVSIGGRVAGDYRIDCAFKSAVLAALPRLSARGTRPYLTAGCS